MAANRISVATFVTGLLLWALAPGAGAQVWWEKPPADGNKVDRLAVDAAITIGVEYIKSKQRPNGSFPGHDGAYPTGMTALCLLTMVKCGVSPSDPAVTRALDFLRYKPFRKTYSAGCLLMALEALHPDGAAAWAESGVKFLLATRQPDHGGTWGYPDNDWEQTGVLGRPDLSNTQYAILGLRSARHLGVKVPAAAFCDAVRSLTKSQKEGGSFHYEGGHLPSGSMTTAGLAILAIAEAEVGRTAEFGRLRAPARAAAKRALRWFERNYTVAWNPHGDRGGRNKSWLAYYLYGIERFCDIKGFTAIGKHDWYDDGARFLLANQSHDGSWGSNEDTCFALLFLRRSHLSIDREIRTEAVAERQAKIGRRRAEWTARVKPPSATEVPFIRDWLVLGPFRVKQDALDPHAHPRPRGALKEGSVSLQKRWQRYTSPGDPVDLEQPLRGGDHRVAYVGTHVWSPRDQDAIVWLGTRDGWRVWVNGEEVGSQRVVAMNGADRWRVPCRLRKGANAVVALLEDETYEWTFWMRVTDRDGNAIPGLRSAPGKARLKRLIKRD